MTRRKLLLTLALLLPLMAWAQSVDPVSFTAKMKKTGPHQAELLFTATIAQGWHVYSTRLGETGPTEASLHLDRLKGATLVGELTHRGKEVSQYDDMFGMTLRYFEDNVTFVQKLRLTGGPYLVDGYLEYGACSNEMCIPPTQVEIHEEGESPDDTPAQIPPSARPNDTIARGDMANVSEPDTLLPTQEEARADTAEAALWAPVGSELAELGDSDSGQGGGNTSLWYIFLEGLLGGLLAIFTPCVWPIIPMTVSFFLKRNKDRRNALREAATYGLSIVAIYVLLGLAVTAIFGASALNALSTNAVFNIFFALLLVVFAASFFGAFELTLPASWANKVDAKSDQTTGLVSIFLMAFTLALVSFSCTGPIIGFLLVAVATQGSILGPAVGMLGFAIALAVPFTLFALFPTLLKQAPKSGGWMNTVKVVLGFVELAFALKFLSVADLAYGWRLLDREVFLSVWIVLFGLLGCYLLGWLRFPHDDEGQKTSVTRFFLGLLSLAFTVYMVPGLWGAPLKAISAFSPPMNTQDFKQQAVATEARFTDYEQGMRAAQAEGKPVMLDFTGYGCVNCRKMEAAVWTDPRVSDRLNSQYVLVSLYVDDKTPLPEREVVTENGKPITLRTVGDRWSHLQRTKFGANAQPFYVLLTPEGRPLTASRAYDEDIPAYVEWLDKGLSAFRRNASHQAP